MTLHRGEDRTCSRLTILVSKGLMLETITTVDVFVRHWQLLVAPALPSPSRWLSLSLFYAEDESSCCILVVVADDDDDDDDDACSIEELLVLVPAGETAAPATTVAGAGR